MTLIPRSSKLNRFARTRGIGRAVLRQLQHGDEPVRRMARRALRRASIMMFL